MQVTEEVWRKLLVDLKEDILQVGHRDTIGKNVKFFEALI